jgi:hypothetical protein
MKPDSNFSFASIGAIANRFIYRYGLLSIFIIIAVGLVASIILLNAVIARTDQSNGYTPAETSITFDESTVQRIENLKMNGEETDQVETNGRLLPF